MKRPRLGSGTAVWLCFDICGTLLLSRVLNNKSTNTK